MHPPGHSPPRRSNNLDFHAQNGLCSEALSLAREKHCLKLPFPKIAAAMKKARAGASCTHHSTEASGAMCALAHCPSQDRLRSGGGPSISGALECCSIMQLAVSSPGVPEQLRAPSGLQSSICRRPSCTRGWGFPGHPVFPPRTSEFHRLGWIYRQSENTPRKTHVTKYLLYVWMPRTCHYCLLHASENHWAFLTVSVRPRPPKLGKILK